MKETHFQFSFFAFFFSLKTLSRVGSLLKNKKSVNAQWDTLHCEKCDI